MVLISKAVYYYNKDGKDYQLFLVIIKSIKSLLILSIITTNIKTHLDLISLFIT